MFFFFAFLEILFLFCLQQKFKENLKGYKYFKKIPNQYQIHPLSLNSTSIRFNFGWIPNEQLDLSPLHINPDRQLEISFEQQKLNRNKRALNHLENDVDMQNNDYYLTYIFIILFLKKKYKISTNYALLLIKSHVNALLLD